MIQEIEVTLKEIFKDINNFGKYKTYSLKDKNKLKKNVIIGKGLVNFNLLFSNLKN